MIHYQFSRQMILHVSIIKHFKIFQWRILILQWGPTINPLIDGNTWKINKSGRWYLSWGVNTTSSPSRRVESCCNHFWKYKSKTDCLCPIIISDIKDLWLKRFEISVFLLSILYLINSELYGQTYNNEVHMIMLIMIIDRLSPFSYQWPYKMFIALEVYYAAGQSMDCDQFEIF